MRKVISFFSDLFRKNPILFMASALSPVVVAGVSLKNGLLLSLAMLIITLPTVIVAYFAFRKLPEVYKTPCTFLLSAVMGILASVAVIKIDSVAFENLGIYLPILSVNSIILFNAFSDNTKKFLPTLRDTILGILSFASVVIIVSTIREFVGNGTILGKELHFDSKIHGFLLPFSGYFIVAFMGAAINYAVNIIKNRRKK